MLKSLLKSLFGTRDVKTNHSYTDYVPGTQLTYDPDLINRLQDDHQERIKLYTSCAKSLEKGNHDQLRKTLEKFNRKLTSHLPLENIRFTPI